MGTKPPGTGRRNMKSCSKGLWALDSSDNHLTGHKKDPGEELSTMR